MLAKLPYNNTPYPTGIFRNMKKKHTKKDLKITHMNQKNKNDKWSILLKIIKSGVTYNFTPL